jgi:hypothetical protein
MRLPSHRLSPLLPGSVHVPASVRIPPLQRPEHPAPDLLHHDLLLRRIDCFFLSRGEEIIHLSHRDGVAIVTLRWLAPGPGGGSSLRFIWKF